MAINELATKYAPVFDRLYTVGDITRDLESANVKFENSKTVKVYKAGTPSVGTYNRTTGYGNTEYAAGSWETWTLANDMKIDFFVDSMDNDETLDQAFVAEIENAIIAMQEDVATKRFAKIVGTAGIGKKEGAITDANVVEEIDAAEVALDEGKTPRAGRILYITPQAYAYLKTTSVTRFATMTDANLNRDFVTYDGAKVVVVPSTLLGANFILLHPTALEATMKHNPIEIFAPSENQAADGFRFRTRYYHDLFVYDNKVKGIYASVNG